jgi:hypothetical protein
MRGTKSYHMATIVAKVKDPILVGYCRRVVG